MFDIKGEEFVYALEICIDVGKFAFDRRGIGSNHSMFRCMDFEK